jgi:protein-disulfide isomerase
MKTIIIAVVAIIAVIGGAVLLSDNKNEDSGASTVGSNNVYGTSSTGVTVVAYEDFECPACGGFFPIFSEVKEKYKDQVSFQFKHFPLVQIHPNATAAHRAAEAAAKQGKFWEMHNILFQNQLTWRGTDNAAATFASYATQIGLDMAKYNADVASSEVISIINKDIEDGKNLGVDGTPSFFVDGKKIEDLTTIDTVEKFSKVIDDAIIAKGGTPQPTEIPASTAPEEIPTE